MSDVKYERYQFRLPEDWLVALRVAAARGRRTLSEEIMQRLEPTMEADLAAEREVQK